MIGAALAREEGRREGPDAQAVGEDHARARARRSSPTTTTRPASRRTWTSSASTSSATAAPRASATPARSTTRSRRRSTTTTSPSPSVLSGNRNFEGRIHPDVKLNYLASPPLVVAYALAGTMDIDLTDRAARHRHRRAAGVPARHLADASRDRRGRRPGDPVGDVRRQLRRRLRRRRALAAASRSPTGSIFEWDDRVHLRAPAAVLRRHARASRRRSPTSTARGCSRCSATRSPPTTSRRPATSRRTRRPGAYLQEHGVAPRDFNSYGSRRGNHEVMIRGTFANIRLRNQLRARHRGRRHPPPARRRSR